MLNGSDGINESKDWSLGLDGMVNLTNQLALNVPGGVPKESRRQENKSRRLKTSE
jgi:hypothetical protein